MVIETKYNILDSLKKIHNSFDKFNLSWDFFRDKDFEKDVSKFIKEKGVLNEDVFYILDTKLDTDKLKNLKCGDVLDFGNETRLEKIGNCDEHNYLYYNDKPLAFGMHVHLNFNEKITPLKNDIIFYVYGGDVEYRKFTLKVGHTYTVPKTVRHAVIFSKDNIIKLIWN